MSNPDVILTINFDNMVIYMDCISGSGAVRLVMTAPESFLLANVISDKATELSEYQAFRGRPMTSAVIKPMTCDGNHADPPCNAIELPSGGHGQVTLDVIVSALRWLDENEPKLDKPIERQAFVNNLLDHLATYSP